MAGSWFPRPSFSMFIHSLASCFIYLFIPIISPFPTNSQRDADKTQVCPSPSYLQPCQASPGSQSETSPPRTLMVLVTFPVISLPSALPGLPVTHLALGALLPQGLCTAVLSAWLSLPPDACAVPSPLLVSAQFYLMEAFPDKPTCVCSIGPFPGGWYCYLQ